MTAAAGDQGVLSGSNNGSGPVGWVYVFAAPHAVKVGLSRTSVEARRHTLADQLGLDLEIVESFEVPWDEVGVVEVRAHGLLAEYRIRGEWFSCTPNVACAAVRRALLLTAADVVDRGRQRLRDAQVRSEKSPPMHLRELRHLSCLSLSELARSTGMHKGRLSELERGDRAATRQELTALEQAYGVELRVVHAIVVDEGEKA